MNVEERLKPVFTAGIKRFLRLSEKVVLWSVQVERKQSLCYNFTVVYGLNFDRQGGNAEHENTV